MTQEQKEALAFLDEQIAWAIQTFGAGESSAEERLRAVKAMVSLPSLPEPLPADEVLTEMAVAFHKADHASTFECMKAAYRALYAHLTRPKTVPRWRVHGIGADREPHRRCWIAQKQEEVGKCIAALQAAGFDQILITTEQVEQEPG